MTRSVRLGSFVLLHDSLIVGERWGKYTGVLDSQSERRCYFFFYRAENSFDTCVDREREKANGDRWMSRCTYPVFQDKADKLQQDVLEIVKNVILEMAYVFMNIHRYLLKYVVSVEIKIKERRGEIVSLLKHAIQSSIRGRQGLH